jgi:hypothetical protein
MGVLRETTICGFADHILTIKAPEFIPKIGKNRKNQQKPFALFSQCKIRRQFRTKTVPNID